jgi:hypothetical protein
VVCSKSAPSVRCGGLTLGRAEVGIVSEHEVQGTLLAWVGKGLAVDKPVLQQVEGPSISLLRGPARLSI